MNFSKYKIPILVDQNKFQSFWKVKKQKKKNKTKKNPFPSSI